MTKINKHNKDNDSKNKRGRETKFMSIKEADLKKGWTEMKVIAQRNFTAPPEVDTNSTDLSDLFKWGGWVAQKSNLTKADSKRLLNVLRKSKKK